MDIIIENISKTLTLMLTGMWLWMVKLTCGRTSPFFMAAGTPSKLRVRGLVLKTVLGAAALSPWYCDRETA